NEGLFYCETKTTSLHYFMRISRTPKYNFNPMVLMYL
ncbi:hypothetical protein NQ317_008916, partial [Molorchus minor]